MVESGQAPWPWGFQLSSNWSCLIACRSLLSHVNNFYFLRINQVSFSLLLFSGLFGLFLNNHHYRLSGDKCWYSDSASVCLSWVALTCMKDKVAPTIREIISMILAGEGPSHCNSWTVDQLSMTPAGLFGACSRFNLCSYIILPIKLIQKVGAFWLVGVGMAILYVPLELFGARIPMSFDIFLQALLELFLLERFLPSNSLLGVSMVEPVAESLGRLSQSLRVFFCFILFIL